MPECCMSGRLIDGSTRFLRGPVNEDVFAVPPYHGGKIVDSDIQEISEQIHRLLLQVCRHTLNCSQIKM